jgi:hypothetical protein
MDFDWSGWPEFVVSPDGTEIAVADPNGDRNRIRRIPLNGSAQSTIEVQGRKPGVSSLGGGEKHLDD